MPQYPIDPALKTFIDNSLNDWFFFLDADKVPEWAQNELQAHGFSVQQVQSAIDQLKRMSVPDLLALAKDDYPDISAALEWLQLQTSEEVFNLATELCRSNEAAERWLGVEMLMRKPGATFRLQALDVLLPMVPSETDNIVLSALAFALLHLDVGDRSERLGHLVTSKSDDLRLSLAQSLGGLRDDTAVNALITLSRDPVTDIRNWATFGLHNGLEFESNYRQDVRDALFERVNDPDGETRHEALEGLAICKDSRVLEPLAAALQGEEVWELAVSAAKEMGHPALHPHLVALKSWWDLRPQLLDEAIEACRPLH